MNPKRLNRANELKQQIDALEKRLEDILSCRKVSIIIQSGLPTGKGSKMKIELFNEENDSQIIEYLLKSALDKEGRKLLALKEEFSRL